MPEKERKKRNLDAMKLSVQFDKSEKRELQGKVAWGWVENWCGSYRV